MASIYKKQFTKPLPEGAETFTRKGQAYARWKDGKGKTQTAELTTGKDGSPRIRQQASTWTARYRDGQNNLQDVATGCRDETAARQVLADLVKRAEHVRSGILSNAEDVMSRYQDVPLSDHISAYVEHLKSKGVTAGRIKTTESRLKRVFDDCGLTRLADLAAQQLEGWLGAQAEQTMSAAARNGYRSACVAFGNWCAGKRGKVTVANQKRLASNPFEGVHKANEKADPKRQRRALTEDELRKLLKIARTRPMLEAKTIRRGEKAGQPVAKLKPETERRLETLGRERALIY